MNRLRVAIVAPSLEILGGQAIQAQRLIDAWQGDPEVDAWLVPVNPTLPRFLSRARGVKFVRTIVNQSVYLPLLFKELARADLVHVFSAAYTSFLLAPLPALCVARALGRPTILNYRSGEGPDHLSRSPLARAAIRRADRAVVPSAFLVDSFANFGLDAEPVPNLLDLDRFRFRERDPLRPRFLSTRNFEPLYNVACTLRAFQLIQRERPDASLTLVGGGSQESRLRTLARELRLEQVTFAGRAKPDEMPTWYAAHDIYMQSPDIDNAPTSVLEAFASGLPVVASDAGGVPAILSHGDHGLLSRVDDHAALAANALQMLADPARARCLALQARATCAQHAWSSVRRHWLRTYRSVARLGTRPARLARPLRGR